MKLRILLLLAMACAALSELSAVTAISLDDDEGEIVILRTKKKKAEPAPTVVAPALEPEAKPEEPPPPPEPPAADAAEPRRLVHYFCKAWKDEDWERLWWAMEPSYRKKVSLKKFTKIFTDDAEGTGGLRDENILEEGKTGTGEGVKVELIFNFPRAKHRIVLALTRRIPGGQYRIAPSPLIPLDYDDL